MQSGSNILLPFMIKISSASAISGGCLFGPLSGPLGKLKPLVPRLQGWECQNRKFGRGTGNDQQRDFLKNPNEGELTKNIIYFMDDNNMTHVKSNIYRFGLIVV